MAQFVLHKDGIRIDSVAKWCGLAPPKGGPKQWKDGRSAKELAKAFFRDGGEARVPFELSALLSSSPNLGHLELYEAIPEHGILLDDFRGETRNADLACLGVCPAGRAAVTIEAKADEEFGPTIRERLAQATNPKSKLPRRVELLRRALFGDLGLHEVEDLRYQLLHATAAPLIYAREKACNLVIFVVYEFVGDLCDPEKLKRNADDLNAFVRILSQGAIGALPVGMLIGPLLVPGGEYVPANFPLYVGKASRRIVNVQ